MPKTIPKTMPKLAPKLSFSIAQALATFNIVIDEIATTKLSNDSRKVVENSVFCAVIGTTLDGRQYIEQAIAQGASLVIAQCQHAQQHGKFLFKESNRGIGAKNGAKKILIVQFYQLDQHLFALAEQYYQSPQQKMKVIGITGTNGKTSTALTITKLLSACQQQAAVIGTIGAGQLNNLTEIDNTTPSATEILTLMTEFVEQNVAYLTMEVSSHALVQKRILPNVFDIAVFTNLSRDHLDYHLTMENYAAAKFSLFDGKSSQIAIVNGEDEYAQAWLTTAKTSSLMVFGRTAEIDKYAKKYQQYVVAQQVQHHENGVTFTLTSHVGQIDITSPLIGDFNVDNLLAAIAVMLSLAFSLNDIQAAIALLTPTIGRMESFKMANKPLSIVDYAHTPDGLLNALTAAKQHCQGELWLVFGCGGDRDKGKRSEMGAIAEKYAQHVIITNDNPRTEAPELIVNDILAGCENSEKITVILNREQAVKSALSHAKPQDCILFAGKGHEDYIVIGREKLPYNERSLVQSYYQEGVL